MSLGMLLLLTILLPSLAFAMSGSKTPTPIDTKARSQLGLGSSPDTVPVVAPQKTEAQPAQSAVPDYIDSSVQNVNAQPVSPAKEIPPNNPNNIDSTGNASYNSNPGKGGNIGNTSNTGNTGNTNTQNIKNNSPNAETGEDGNNTSKRKATEKVEGRQGTNVITEEAPSASEIQSNSPTKQPVTEAAPNASEVKSKSSESKAAEKPTDYIRGY